MKMLMFSIIALLFMLSVGGQTKTNDFMLLAKSAMNESIKAVFESLESINGFKGKIITGSKPKDSIISGTFKEQELSIGYNNNKIRVKINFKNKHSYDVFRKKSIALFGNSGNDTREFDIVNKPCDVWDTRHSDKNGNLYIAFYECYVTDPKITSYYLTLERYWMAW